MAKILLIGCGDLGSEVARLLVAAQHTVVGVRRSDRPYPHGQCIQADITQADSLKPLTELKPDIVIYCVAASAQTDEAYRQQYVEGLKHVLETQKRNTSLKHVFFISSTRVYGQKTHQVLDETVEAVAADFGGERLLEAEWFLKTLPCATTAIRLSGIYGPGRLYLVRMAQEVSRWPAANKWTNRIHRDDAAAFVAFLTQQVIAGHSVDDCYIGTDHQPTLQYDVLQWIAQQLGTQVPTLAEEGAVGGKQLSNQRLRATGFQLQYPNYQVGYGAVLAEQKTGRDV